MSIIWVSFIGLAISCAMLLGKTDVLTAAMLEGAQAGITLAVSLAGPFCLWSGLAVLLRETGATDRTAAIFRPLLRRLFPAAFSDSAARQALCGNFSANLLGLGNAATPMGIAAVQRMRHLSGSERATDEMCRFIVLNTASVQLIPTTVAAVRAGLHAAAPLDILPAVWVTSICSVTVGLLAAWGLSKCFP